MIRSKRLPTRCPACHMGTWKPDRRQTPVWMGDQCYTVDVPGHVCSACPAWRPDPVWGDGTRRGGRTWSTAWGLHSAAFKRAHPRCDWPGCPDWATESHHVVYRSRGGSDDWANLRPLCKAHHEQVHREGGRDDD